MTVALYRLTARFANGVFESSHGLLLRSGCPRHVEDFFFQNRAVQIVHTIAECHLCKWQSKTNPVGRQVIYIIQINAAHSEIAKLLECRSTFDVG